MKRYLITGASRGIGRAIAQKLAAPGHMLLLHGRNREALAKTCRLVEARKGKAIPLSYDLRRAARVEKMLAAIGPEPLDGLIHNAGIALVKPFEEITLTEWDTLFAVNVTAPFLLTQQLAPDVLSGWKMWAAEHARGFQRASSAVEGRNGSLSQLHQDSLSVFVKKCAHAASASLTFTPPQPTPKSGTRSRETGPATKCCCRKKSGMPWLTPCPGLRAWSSRTLIC